MEAHRLIGKKVTLWCFGAAPYRPCSDLIGPCCKVVDQIQHIIARCDDFRHHRSSAQFFQMSFSLRRSLHCGQFDLQRSTHWNDWVGTRGILGVHPRFDLWQPNQTKRLLQRRFSFEIPSGTQNIPLPFVFLFDKIVRREIDKVGHRLGSQ